MRNMTGKLTVLTLLCIMFYLHVREYANFHCDNSECTKIADVNISAFVYRLFHEDFPPVVVTFQLVNNALANNGYHCSDFTYMPQKILIIEHIIHMRSSKWSNFMHHKLLSSKFRWLSVSDQITAEKVQISMSNHKLYYRQFTPSGKVRRKYIHIKHILTCLWSQSYKHILLRKLPRQI